MHMIWSKCSRTIEVILVRAKNPLARLQIAIATSHKAFHISDRKKFCNILKKKSATCLNLKLAPVAFWKNDNNIPNYIITFFRILNG